MTTTAIDHEIRLADTATITQRFASPQWGESHSGTYLASKLAPHAGTSKPAIGVIVALSLALADYADSLGPASSFVIPTLEMRMGQIAEIITVTPGDADSLRAAIAAVDATP